MATEKVCNGQVYVSVGEEPYERKDGTMTTLTIWRSNCAACGEPFDVKISSAASKFIANRRCEKHKRPGLRVQSR
jgi:hypothetical protein